MTGKKRNLSPSKPRKSENGATMSSRFGRTDGQRLWMEGACLRSRTLSHTRADFCRVTRDKSSYPHLSRRVERGRRKSFTVCGIFGATAKKGGEGEGEESRELVCLQIAPRPGVPAPRLQRERERGRAKR